MIRYSIQSSHAHGVTAGMTTIGNQLIEEGPIPKFQAGGGGTLICEGHGTSPRARVEAMRMTFYQTGGFAFSKRKKIGRTIYRGVTQKFWGRFKGMGDFQRTQGGKPRLFYFESSAPFTMQGGRSVEVSYQSSVLGIPREVFRAMAKGRRVEVELAVMARAGRTLRVFALGFPRLFPVPLRG
jgi:hypothetical protein